jgi:uncharacterized membrane protein
MVELPAASSGAASVGTVASGARFGMPGRPQPQGAADWLFVAYLVSMPVYCLVRLYGDASSLWIATALTCGCWFACTLAAAHKQLGSLRTLAMLFSGFAFAFATEYLGSRYGLLFGEYSYTALLGYKLLGQVPVLIPTAWFMMLYPSWKIAGQLTTMLKLRTTKIPQRALRVVLGAAAMTAWDLSLDPRWVADGAWVWPHGGIYFGIPLSNFVGWFVTATLIFCVWTLIDRRAHTAHESRLPQWVYATTWIGESMANVFFWSGPLIGAIVFVAMGVFALPVVRRELR